MIDNIIDELDDDALGITVGRRHTLGSFGLLGFGLLSSPTGLSALELSMTYWPLTYVFTEPVVDHREGYSAVTLPPVGVRPQTEHFLADLWVATLASAIRAVAPGNRPFLSVDLPRPVPSEPQIWASTLGVPPRFAADEARVALDERTLALRVPTADAQARLYCEHHCAELLAQRSNEVGAGITDKVRERLLSHAGQMPSQAQVAVDLNLSERTLQRQLAAQGQSYRQIRDEVRLTLARRMLDQPQLTIAHISTVLGYDHPASFTRAYYRWTGHRPSEAR